LRHLPKGLSFAILFVASLGAIYANGEAPRDATASNVFTSTGRHITHATWYAGKCIGRLTAGGKRYEKNAAFVATHEPYPFGTKLLITNLHNHRSIVVPVEDREPYHPGRTLDLSYAAAKQLDMLSTGVVLVSYAPLISPS
jgi:rare lipoprotein A (peptidoglycan hydrolase)